MRHHEGIGDVASLGYGYTESVDFLCATLTKVDAPKSSIQGFRKAVYILNNYIKIFE